MLAQQIVSTRYRRGRLSSPVVVGGNVEELMATTLGVKVRSKANASAGTTTAPELRTALDTDAPDAADELGRWLRAAARTVEAGREAGAS